MSTRHWALRPRSDQRSSLTSARTGETTGSPSRMSVPSGSSTTTAVTVVRSGPAVTSPPAKATHTDGSAKPCAWPHHHESGNPPLPQFFSA